MDASAYSAPGTLRDGRRLEIRALEPGDRAGLLDAVDRSSEQSRYRRFFSVKRTFSEKEMQYFTNLDYVNHVALVAVVEEAGGSVVVGGGRYIVTQPGRAEVAFGVDDAHQGQGIATQLLRSLISIARTAGLKELVAEVLPDNGPMLRVFESSGLRVATRREQDVVHVSLGLQ